MLAIGRTLHDFFWNRDFILTLMLLLLCPCGRRKADAQGDDGIQPAKAMNEISEREWPSAHYFLSVSGAKEFREGRPKIDILADINWVGNFQMAGPRNDGSACVISYDLFSKGVGSEGGEVVFAVFVNDRFVEFVKWYPAEMDHVPYGKTTRSVPKPIDIGDVRWLNRAVEAKAVRIAELEKEFTARPPVPDQIDPGLTIAYLLLRATGKAPGPDDLGDYKTNAQLRNQFNAARLAIGMSEVEVEEVFKAKPLETFQVEAGSVSIYGSGEQVDVDFVIAYSNVLVLFKQGKASAIYAIEGGPDWRTNARQRFSNFPK